MELIERMEEMAINNYYDAVLHLGYLLQLNSGSFQSYQISLLLNRLHAAAITTPLQLHKLCAGPGMVPLSLQLSTNAKIGVACEDAGAPVEQAEDEEEEVVVGGDVAADVEVGGDAEIPVDDATAGEDNTQKTALDEALDSITVQGSCDATSFRQAVQICQIMVHVLHDSSFVALLQIISNCKLEEVVDFDVMEYCICEHRRLLCKPKKRVSKRALPVCKFVTTHRAHLRSTRAAMIAWLQEKHRPCKRQRTS